MLDDNLKSAKYKVYLPVCMCRFYYFGCPGKRPPSICSIVGVWQFYFKKGILFRGSTRTLLEDHPYVIISYRWGVKKCAPNFLARFTFKHIYIKSFSISSCQFTSLPTISLNSVRPISHRSVASSFLLNKFTEFYATNIASISDCIHFLSFR